MNQQTLLDNICPHHSIIPELAESLATDLNLKPMHTRTRTRTHDRVGPREEDAMGCDAMGKMCTDAHNVNVWFVAAGAAVPNDQQRCLLTRQQRRGRRVRQALLVVT